MNQTGSSARPPADTGPKGGSTDEEVVDLALMSRMGPKRDVPDLRTARQGLAKRRRELNRKLAQLKEMVGPKRSDGEDLQRRAANDFDRLLDYPLALSASVEGKTVIVRSGPFRIATGSAEYDLGRYEIRISTDRDRILHDLTFGIRIWSVDRPTRSTKHQHPHVRNDGHPCLGNMKTYVLDMLKERRFADVGLTCTRFLESYDSDDPFAKIECWPPLKEGRTGTRPGMRRPENGGDG